MACFRVYGGCIFCSSRRGCPLLLVGGIDFSWSSYYCRFLVGVSVVVVVGVAAVVIDATATALLLLLLLLTALLLSVTRCCMCLGYVLPFEQGQTQGFTVASLLKLSTLVSFDKKTNFLQFVVMVAEKNNPDLLGFTQVSDRK